MLPFRLVRCGLFISSNKNVTTPNPQSMASSPKKYNLARRFIRVLVRVNTSVFFVSVFFSFLPIVCFVIHLTRSLPVPISNAIPKVVSCRAANHSRNLAPKFHTLSQGGTRGKRALTTPNRMSPSVPRSQPHTTLDKGW